MGEKLCTARKGIPRLRFSPPVSLKKGEYRMSKDRHHVLPVSIGGTDHPDNIVMVDKRRHAVYHILFCNLSPVCIVAYLVNHWWNGNWGFVEEALRKKDDLQVVDYPRPPIKKVGDRRFVSE